MGEIEQCMEQDISNICNQENCTYMKVCADNSIIFTIYAPWNDDLRRLVGTYQPENTIKYRLVSRFVIYSIDNAIYDIVNGRKYEGNTGIYHYSNEGVCSWFDFTKMIAMLSGRNDCDIQPCHSDEFPSPVIRPSYSVFDKTKVKNTFGVKVPYWLDSLKTCLKNMNELNQ